MELLRDTEPGPAGGSIVGPSGEEVPRPRMSPATIAAKVSRQLPSQTHLCSQVNARMPTCLQMVFRAYSLHLNGAL